MRIFNKLARLNLTIKNFIRFNSEIFLAKGKREMKRIIVMLAAVILLMTGCGTENDSRETIIVGFDESPLGYRDESGEIVGFEIDLAREAINRAGAKPEFKIIHWNEKEMELNSGNIDMIFNGMDITPERQEIMLFSKPYMDNRRVIVVMKGNPLGIVSEGDLDGKNVGVKAGTTAEFYFETEEGKKNNIKTLKTYDSDEKVFNALESGKIDAVVCDEVLGRYYVVKHNNNIEVLNITVGKTNEYGIGFRKDDHKLRDRIQAAFDSVVKDGTAKKISEKWFQADLIKRNVN